MAGFFRLRHAALGAAALAAGLAMPGGVALAADTVKGTVTLLPSLANPGHQFSAARAISGNGQVIVGVSASPDTYEGRNGFHAVMWNSDTQVTDLGSIGGNVRNTAEANAVSFDGSVIAGTSTIDLVGTPGAGAIDHAFIYSGGKFTDLGSLRGATGNSTALGLSADGRIAVGESQFSSDCECSATTHAFRWTNGRITDLGSLVGDFGNSSARGTNAAGDLTVGVSSAGFRDSGVRMGAAPRSILGGGGGSYTFGNDKVFGPDHAVYWAGTNAPVDLGSLAGFNGNSFANAVNARGSVANAVIVGGSDTSFDSESVFTHATKWTLTNGVAARPVDLGTIGNVVGNSVANAVNAVGTIIVGNSDTTAGKHAFRWSAGEGLRDLNTLLTSAGVDLGSIVLTTANGISADGQFIVGSATTGAVATAAPAGRAAASRSFAAAAVSPNPTQAYIARYVSAANIGGVTTVGSVLGSVASLGATRQGQIVTTRVLTGILQGVNEQVNCDNCVSAFGAVGSFSAGIHGRYSLSNRLTFLAGAAFAQFKQNGVEVTSAPLLAAALRYDLADWGASRPFFEVGVTGAPDEKVRYRRQYANGAGLATGSGNTRVSSVAVYGRAGWVWRFSPVDEVAAAAELWSGWQHVGGYQEPFSQNNPFEATVLGGADHMSLVKLGAQWTHLFGSSVEANVNGGVVRSFDSRSGVAAIIPGFGLIKPRIKDVTWVEYGARIGYRINKNTIVDLFADGASGEKPVGTHVHGGVGLRLNF